MDDTINKLIAVGHAKAKENGVFTVNFGGDNSQGFFFSREKVQELLDKMNEADQDTVFLLIKRGPDFESYAKKESN